MMQDILRRIKAYKGEEIAAAKQEVSWNEVVARAHDAPTPRPRERFLPLWLNGQKQTNLP